MSTRTESNVTKQVRLKVTKENLAKLEKMAEKQEQSISWILNRILEAI